MTQMLPPTVCLDGAAVRRIREEKKLTQLYVAKVVGVTTDTISRWENNRYPSIKRENALRLAEALEAPVEDILQGGTGICTMAEPALPPRRLIYRALPIFLVLFVLAAVYFFVQRQQAPADSLLAERVLPKFAAPGSSIPVQVRLEAGSEMKGFILREHFPPGWKLIEASPPPSSLDNEEGTARWIVKPGEERRMIAYLVKVDRAAELGREGTFSGEAVANPNGRNTPSPVTGATQLRIGPFQWADLNGDNVIDDSEMLQASDTVDSMKDIHLNWRQLEEIWDAGGYRWDERREQFVPHRIPHPSP
ncbi:MAG TPA: helix-turn-helix transcriptional regulator [Desulfuromonadales bacterium]|nr:helix-turn-helix transcriptional regulator [Desulfuromonadales bacterium]